MIIVFDVTCSLNEKLGLVCVHLVPTHARYRLKMVHYVDFLKIYVYLTAKETHIIQYPFNTRKSY